VAIEPTASAVKTNDRSDDEGNIFGKGGLDPKTRLSLEYTTWNCRLYIMCDDERCEKNVVP
jgi:hypothetical protein